MGVVGRMERDEHKKETYDGLLCVDVEAAIIQP
jgi:hypothetical protein